MIELFKDIKVDWLGKRKLFLVMSLVSATVVRVTEAAIKRRFVR